MRNHILLPTTLSVLLAAAAAGAADWNTAPGYYTHDPQTGQRTNQYAPIGPFYIAQDPSYRRSGFRHSRSSLQVGNSADHVIVVEEWGRQVRPFGEWRYPFRPYSVPYEAWGPDYGGYGYGGVGYGGVGYDPYGGAGGGSPPYPPLDRGAGGGYPGPVDAPPYFDGSYSDQRRRGHFEGGNQPYDYSRHGYRPYPPTDPRPRPGVGGINIGPGNSGAITVDNDGVDGSGNTVGGDVNNGP